jgi:hypothetical protein
MVFTMLAKQYLIMKQIGGSMFLRLPIKYIRENGYQQGDIVIWNPDDSTFKVVKQSDFRDAEAEFHETVDRLSEKQEAAE